MDSRSFLALVGATRPKRAPARALERAEATLGRPLPASLRSFYELTDGLDLAPLGRLRLLSLAEMLEHHRGLDVWGVPDEWKYLPFAWCEGTSDRLCVAAHPALDARVVWVLHDDGPVVAFPDLAHLLDAIADAHRKHHGGSAMQRLARAASSLLSGDEDDFLNLHELPRWYRTHQERSASDAASARQLLDRYHPRLRDDRTDVIAMQGVAFACTLLAPTDVDTLVELLDVLDPYQRYAVDRLRAIASDASASALAEYHSALATVGRRIEAAALAAGHEASLSPPDETGEVHELVVGGRRKALHLRTAYWYERRNDPELETRFARWLAEQAAR